MLKGFVSLTRQVKEQCAKGKLKAVKVQLQLAQTGKFGKQEDQTEYIVSKAIGHSMFVFSHFHLKVYQHIV